jgi:hypothetical protein
MPKKSPTKTEIIRTSGHEIIENLLVGLSDKGKVALIFDEEELSIVILAVQLLQVPSKQTRVDDIRATMIEGLTKLRQHVYGK